MSLKLDHFSEEFDIDLFRAIIRVSKHHKLLLFIENSGLVVVDFTFDWFFDGEYLVVLLDIILLDYLGQVKDTDATILTAHCTDEVMFTSWELDQRILLFHISTNNQLEVDAFDPFEVSY